jgi:uncharacterized protein (DUF983 family)
LPALLPVLLNRGKHVSQPDRSAAPVGNDSPLIIAAIKGECPHCGQPTLFDGWLLFASKCRSCGLDYSVYNVGDGPAAFLTMLLGALVCIFALSLQLAVSPPFWVHIILWVPFLLVAVIGSLRVSKAAMLIVEHRNEVREGRLSDQPRDGQR